MQPGHARQAPQAPLALALVLLKLSRCRMQIVEPCHAGPYRLPAPLRERMLHCTKVLSFQESFQKEPGEKLDDLAPEASDFLSKRA